MSDLALVILAAGQARRFGSIKQLALLNGKPLAQHVIDVCSTIPNTETLIVLDADQPQIRQALDISRLTVLINHNSSEGIASSIREAVTASGIHKQGLLFIAADQIAVKRGDLLKLIAEWRTEPKMIVAASYAKDLGIPVIFPKRFYTELLALRGDRGAKKILTQYRDQLKAVAMPAAAVDIDTPQDLAQFIKGPSNFLAD